MHYVVRLLKKHVCVHVNTGSEVIVIQWCPALCGSMEPARLLCPGNFPDKDTGVGCHFLIHGIFPMQGLNLGLPYCRQILYHLSHQVGPTCVYIHLQI